MKYCKWLWGISFLSGLLFACDRTFSKFPRELQLSQNILKYQSNIKYGHRLPDTSAKSKVWVFNQGVGDKDNESWNWFVNPHLSNQHKGMLGLVKNLL